MTVAAPDYSALRRQIDDYDLLVATVGRDTPLRAEAGNRRARGLCPFHSESTPSFVCFRAGGYHCYGCGAHGANVVDYLLDRRGAGRRDPEAFKATLADLGLRPTGAPRLALPPAARPAPAARADASDRPPQRDANTCYDYRDAAGTLRYQVCRWDLTPAEAEVAGKTKTFRQRTPDGRGGWLWRGPAEADQLLYRLPELLAADPTLPIYICEGEKAVEAVRQVGLLATTASGGAGQWPSACSPHFAGRRVIILPDHDARGEEHARLVADELRAVGATVSVLGLWEAWPAMPAHGDVVEFLAAWHGDALRALAAYAPPLPALDVDPVTGETRDGPGLDAETGAAVAALLGDLAGQVESLQAEAATWAARQARIDDLMTNAEIDTAGRVALYNLQRYCEQHDLTPGASAEVIQKEVAAEWGVSADTVSRWLDTYERIGLASHQVTTETVVVRTRGGAPVVDAQTGEPRKKHRTRTVVALHARPFEATISLASPPGKSGAQHGGRRTSCPNVTCPAPTAPQKTLKECTSCGTVYDPQTGVTVTTLEPHPAPLPLPPRPRRPGPPRSQRDADLGQVSLRVAAAALRAPAGAPPYPVSECAYCGAAVYICLPLGGGRYTWQCPCRVEEASLHA